MMDIGKRPRQPILYTLLGSIYRLSGVHIVPLDENVHDTFRFKLIRAFVSGFFWIQFIGTVGDYCLYHQSWRQTPAVDTFQCILSWMCAFAFHLHVTSKSMTIRRFMRDIEMEDFVRRHMKLAIIINLGTLVTIILWIHSSGLVVYPGLHAVFTEVIFSDKNSLLYHFVYRFFNILSLISLTPQLTSLTLYCTTLFTFHCWIERKLHLLKMHSRTQNSDEMILILSDMRDKFCTFETIFNMFPVLWLTPEFIRIPQYIIFFTGPQEKRDNLGINIYFILVFEFVDKLAKLLALIFISLVNEKISSHEDSLVIEYRGQGTPLKDMPLSLARELKVTFDQRFTAWSIDPISRSFITSYTAAVVTFSTLIVQIQHGSLRS